MLRTKLSRLFSLLLVFAMLVSLFPSCAILFPEGNGKETEKSTANFGSEDDTGESESESESTSTEEDYVIPDETVFSLSDITDVGDNLFDGYTTLFPGPDGTIVINTEAIGDGEAFSMGRSAVIYDVKKNKLGEKFNVPDDGYLLNYEFTDGTIGISSNNENKVTFYDTEWNECGVLTSDAPLGGFYSHDKTKYYYISDRLHEVDLATGADRLIKIGTTDEGNDGMRCIFIAGMHRSLDVLIISVYTEPYGDSQGYAVVDLTDGSLLWLRENYADFMGEGLIGGTLTDENGDMNLYCKQLEAETIYEFAVPSDQACYQIIGGDGAFYISPDADKAPVYLSFTDGMPSRYELTELTGSYNIAYTSSCCYVEETDCIAVTSFATYSDTKAKIFFVNRAKLGESVQVAESEVSRLPSVSEDILSEFKRLSAPVTLRAELSELRARADEIEKKYGIEILMSDECVIPVSYSYYAVASTSEFFVDNEVRFIDNALSQLELSLAHYPEGFFRQFKHGIYTGMRIMLTSAVTSSYLVSAYQYVQDNAYNIVADVTYNDMEGTFCHEIWHAMENFINFHDYSLLDYEIWKTFNPENFAYSEDYEKWTTLNSDYTYVLESDPDRIYFIDSYAKTYLTEDRARLMEYSLARSESVIDEFMVSPHMKQKLSFLAKAIRAAFNTEGWPETCDWELPLAE